MINILFAKMYKSGSCLSVSHFFYLMRFVYNKEIAYLLTNQLKGDIIKKSLGNAEGDGGI